MNEEEELTVREVLARLTHKVFDVNDYSIIAQARGHEVVWYETFGSYQGTWVMLTATNIISGKIPTVVVGVEIAFRQPVWLKMIL